MPRPTAKMLLVTGAARRIAEARAAAFVREAIARGGAMARLLHGRGPLDAPDRGRARCVTRTAIHVAGIAASPRPAHRVV
jgi:hypothetical protein